MKSPILASCLNIILCLLVITISACSNDDDNGTITKPETSSDFIPIILGSWEDPNTGLSYSLSTPTGSAPFYQSLGDIEGSTPDNELFIGTFNYNSIVFDPDPSVVASATISESFTGRFIDLETLIVNRNGNQIYKHDFFPNFTEGVWVNVANSQHKLKFVDQINGTISGCELTDITQTTFTGSFDSVYVIELNIPRSTETILLSGKFSGLSTLELASTDQQLEFIFQRVDLTDNCI